MNKVIITLVGPTCSGKTTLKDQLLNTGRFIEVISHTTRPKRNGEVDGETYHFVTKEVFDTMEFLERIEYNGNIYGGSVQEFEKGFASGQIPVIIVEPNGNRQINLNAREKGWTVINVWVGCPIELQAERLVRRLIQDYKSFLHSDDHGGIEPFNKLIKEYVGRLTMVQTVERDWPDLFADSTLYKEAEEHGAPVVMTLPHFGKDNEDEQRDRLIQVAESYRTRNPV